MLPEPPTLNVTPTKHHSSMSKKTYKKILSHDEALLCRAKKFKKRDEARDDHTLQRSFERRFESRDMPDSEAARAGYSDGGKGVWLLTAFDAPEYYHTRNWYDAVLEKAARILPNELRYLHKLLFNIYKYRGDKAEIRARTYEGEDPESWAVYKKYWRDRKKLLNFFTRPSILAKMRVLRSEIKA